MPATAARLHTLLEPVHLVTYFAEEPTQALTMLGLRGYWDGYFAGRAAPLGRVGPEVVDTVFYNFAPGEVARHVPHVWEVTSPRRALRARESGSVAALARILGPLPLDTPLGVQLSTAAALASQAARHAPVDGRPLTAALQALPFPPAQEPLARLWHAATILREHRGEGHHAVLASQRIGGIQSHLLLAAWKGDPPRSFGRVHHLPRRVLDPEVAALQARGLLDADERITYRGRALRDEIEKRTNLLAVPAYSALTPGERARLEECLTPLARLLVAAGSR
ncbi:MarR family transcriptional regulator [Nocardioides sp. GY 10127]|uniref:SCO6745 family protein n=1 Tax=Nocardioides sp. GY 10127 TaxID=2569762 RepID=UPI0010A77767|nr:MarR family transcriptional regulator [Nocardioides sp. GY 10127]TIC86458.1 MarR family transcriptional regulator [Nocardioides sp. GY 10127]